MSYSLDRYITQPAAAAPVSARVAFIKRTYMHLAVAMLAFVGIEAGLIVSGLGVELVRNVFVMPGSWIALMILFLVGGMAAQYMAVNSHNVGVQYAGLAMYVLLESAIFLPLLTYVSLNPKYGPMLPLEAGVVTLAVFGALTIAVFVSGRDFSFMGPFLWVISSLALVGVVLAVIFGVSIGLFGCLFFVGLYAAYVIYITSNIIHQYGTNQHVAASLFLFAALATLLWYVIRIFMIARDD